MVQLSKTNIQLKDKPLPTDYFDLIQKVGSKGKYQRNVFFIFSLNWLITSLLIMQSVFLFLNPPLDCAKQGLMTNECETIICQIKDKNIRQKFYAKDEQISTISTQQGPFFCEDSFTIRILQSILFVGIFFGYLFFMYFTDNYGRKMGILLAWSIATLGIAILSLSFNLWMAIVGLFFAGAGSQSAIRVSMTILGQIAEYNLRQRYSVALQIAFGAGSVLIPILYYLIQDWRIINLAFILFPSIVLELLFIFYFEQTPKFLLNKSNEVALKALNRIGQINFDKKEILTDEDIDNVRIQQVEDGDQFSNKVITPIDLVRFKSLRLKTVCVLLMFFMINSVYFGPVFIVQSLGLNVYLSQIIVGGAQLISYPFAYFYVQNLSRQKTGVICFGIVSIFLGILVFLRKPENCDGCAESIIELFCVFCARFTVCFYFSLFFLYATELFPLRARAMGFGIGSAAGAIGSSVAPLIFGILIDLSITPMIYLLLCSIIAIAILFFLPETLNKPLQIQIQEIAFKKKEIKVNRTTFLQSKLISNISKKHQN